MGSKIKRTSLTELRQQMSSGDLLAYLSLNRLFIDIVKCSLCYFVQNLPRNHISQKLNSFVIDGPTDGWTDGRTDTHSVIEMLEFIKKLKKRRWGCLNRKRRDTRENFL